jgi:hypothetical protein
MTTYNDAKKAILDRFVAQTTLASDRYCFDNENFQEPEDSSPWARVTVRHIGGNQRTLGPPGLRRFDRRGSVFIQIMTSSDTGTSSADLLAAASRAIFEAKSFSGLDFHNADIRVTPGVDGWWTTLVECPFQYQEIL